MFGLASGAEAGKPRPQTTASVALAQDLAPYRFPVTCGGFASEGTVVRVSAAESGGLPVRLRFGWAALQTEQLDQFLKVQNGAVTLKAPDGTTYFADNWGTGVMDFDPLLTSGWGSYQAVTLSPDANPDGAKYPGWATSRYELFGQLHSGADGVDAVYLLSMDLQITTGVNDGFGAGIPGSWVKLTDCPLVAHKF